MPEQPVDPRHTPGPPSAPWTPDPTRPAWPSFPPTPPVGPSFTPGPGFPGAAAGPALPPSPPPPGNPISSGHRSPGHPAPPERKTRRALSAGLVAAAVFAAGAGGVLVGKDIAAGPVVATSSPADGVSHTVSTVPGPVASDATEPVAAVAAALSPAVVQIETQQGLGSGFIYDRSGLILTAAHVTDGANQVQVRMADGTNKTGRVLGSDDNTDVAVVKIAGSSDLPVAALATGVKLEVGQTAVAIGSPFGLDQTVTAGIVSAIGRSTETPGQRAIPAIQTDAPINSGNSGGALADRRGRVIGINDSIITGSQGSSGNVGVGFAIPIDIAKAVADRIVAGRSTASGFLGVRSTDSNGNRAGAAIVDVQAGSPAAKAGITTDDVVVALDGQKVQSSIDLVAAVTPHEPGEKVNVTLLRNGKERTVSVTLASN